MIRVNDVVKYAQPKEGEEDFRFTVLEVNGDRCMGELICSEFHIKPVETLALSEVVDANQVAEWGFTVTEDGLTDAIFDGAALDALGSGSKGDARRLARAMICGPALQDATSDLLAALHAHYGSVEGDGKAPMPPALSAPFAKLYATVMKSRGN